MTTRGDRNKARKEREAAEEYIAAQIAAYYARDTIRQREGGETSPQEEHDDHEV